MSRYKDIVLNQFNGCLLKINPETEIVSVVNRCGGGSKVKHTSGNIHFVYESCEDIQALITKADKQK